MTEKKDASTGNYGATDFAKLDAQEVRPEEYEDAPELTDEWFERAERRDGDRLVRRGRPKAEFPKQPTSIRLSREVLDYFRTTGPGWQTRIDAALKEWISGHGGRRG